MHATEILRRTLYPALDPMHARRRKVLLNAVQSLIAGRRFEHVDYERPFLGFDKGRELARVLVAAVGASCLQGGGKVHDIDRVRIRQEHCPFYTVLEFPHIARPFMGKERLYGGR